jgi:hypothetical protein
MIHYDFTSIFNMVDEAGEAEKHPSASLMEIARV